MIAYNWKGAEEFWLSNQNLRNYGLPLEQQYNKSAKDHKFLLKFIVLNNKTINNFSWYSSSHSIAN